MTARCIGIEIVLLAARLCLGQDIEQSHTTVVECPPVVEWSEADQAAAEKALRPLPKGDALRVMARNYVRQRDVNRRCLTERDKLKK